MADEDKPFICYKSGWNLKLMPRYAAGWWALVLWLLAFAPPTAGFAWLMNRQPGEAQAAAWVVAYVLVAIAWAAAMIRWMYLRSEVVDLDELLKLKRRLEREKRRGRH